MNDLWPALKVFLGYGATGATAVLFIIFWVRERAETKRLNEARIQSEKDHGKDMMKLQADSTKEVIALTHQVSESLSMINVTLDKLLAKEE